MLLWQEHQADNPEGRTYQYSQYCEHYRRWAKTLKRSMRQIHRAGEKLFVDFAGPTLGLSDGSRAHGGIIQIFREFGIGLAEIISDKK